MPQPGTTGVVESVREVAVPGEAKGGGAVTGGILGGLLGSQFGSGGGRKLLTVLGAAGGAVAGHNIEKDATATKRWEISVRLDDGSTKTLSSDVQPVWHAGDRVRYLDGRLQPA
ncbi:MAG TPA: glycine zipper 2TM domain-containing protein [Burkholderiales bacterium]